MWVSDDSAVKNTVQPPTNLFGRLLAWRLTQMHSKTCAHEIGVERDDVIVEGFFKNNNKKTVC